MQYIDLLSHLPPGLSQGISCFSFNRWGGTSPRPFDELNVGDAVGDSEDNVRANLELIKDFSGVKGICSLRQVHGSRVYRAGSCHENTLRACSQLEGDGLLSSSSGLGLMIKHADCQAVVMFDPVKRVVANIHCGWRGSVKGILPRAVKKFLGLYGSRPQDIWAGISPSIGPCCGEFRSWKQDLPKWMHAYQVGPGHFDFWAISIHQLASAGVPADQIFCPGICTVCNGDYFSYRREGITGRLATLIALFD